LELKPDKGASLINTTAFISVIPLSTPESLNVVIGRISDTRMGNPNWVHIRNTQVTLAEEEPHGAWVNTDDLNDKVNKDGQTVNYMHYTKDGYKLLGERFAEKAIGLIEKQKAVKK
jgi:hypothetical protein